MYRWQPLASRFAGLEAQMRALQDQISGNTTGAAVGARGLTGSTSRPNSAGPGTHSATA